MQSCSTRSSRCAKRKKVFRTLPYAGHTLTFDLSELPEAQTCPRRALLLDARALLETLHANDMEDEAVAFG